MNRKGIFWLASYPKSGNTWLRVFLSNLKSPSSRPAQLNCLSEAMIASSRLLFDNWAGVESSDMTPDEITCLRPRMYEALSRDLEEHIFMKVHDACIATPDGHPIFPESATAGALYLIRNPLDLVASFAHHFGIDRSTAIERMSDQEFALCSRENKLHGQLRQPLLSWSGHVTSWVKDPGFPVCVVRYEDMKRQPLETFEKAVGFLGLDHDRSQIEDAIARSRFEELQRQEAENGFRERSSKSKSFFRKGEVGLWREELTPEEAQRVIQDHFEVMKQFNYLDHEGNPVI